MLGGQLYSDNLGVIIFIFRNKSKTKNMPKMETVLGVFVASPSNVLDERNKLEEVVNNVNSVLARKTGVRLDLLRDALIKSCF